MTYPRPFRWPTTALEQEVCNLLCHVITVRRFVSNLPDSVHVPDVWGHLKDLEALLAELQELVREEHAAQQQHRHRGSL